MNGSKSKETLKREKCNHILKWNDYERFIYFLSCLGILIRLLE